MHNINRANVISRIVYYTQYCTQCFLTHTSTQSQYTKYGVYVHIYVVHCIKHNY